MKYSTHKISLIFMAMWLGVVPVNAQGLSWCGKGGKSGPCPPPTPRPAAPDDRSKVPYPKQPAPTDRGKTPVGTIAR
jgi:hypothetical protein